MAIKHLTSIDLNKNELQNAVIQPLGANPASPLQGQVYFNTAQEKIYVYDGTDWVPVGDVHTIEGNSINLNGTVSPSTPGSSTNPPLIEVHESDDGTDTGLNGDHDHGIVDLRILETDGIYEDIAANGDKGEFLVRSKHIFDYIKDYVTISGTTNEVDVYTSDVNQSPRVNPSISEGATLYIGLPKDIIIGDKANSVLGETGASGNGSLEVQGNTTLGVQAGSNTVTIHGNTTIGDSTNYKDLTSNGNATIGVAGQGHEVQLNANTQIGDSTNANTLTVWGDLTVKGTTTTVDSETVTIADNFILLNSNYTGSPIENAGIEIERGTDPNVFLRWNETDDKWEITEDGTNYERILTGHDHFKASIGDGSSNSFVITHNLGTRDVTVQIYDTTTHETVMADVARTTINTITVTVANIAGNIPGTNGLRVLIQKIL
jgi:hypothetical protein